MKRLATFVLIFPLLATLSACPSPVMSSVTTTIPETDPKPKIPEATEGTTESKPEEDITTPAEEEEEEIEPEPEVIPLTKEQEIRHFGENVCGAPAPEGHIDIHSEEALALLEMFSNNNNSMDLSDFGIYASSADVRAQCYKGSDLHTQLTGAFHAYHIAEFSKTLNTGCSVGGIVSYDLANNNKVKEIKLPEITIKTGTNNPNTKWDFFYGARPSYGDDETVFVFSR